MLGFELVDEEFYRVLFRHAEILIPPCRDWRVRCRSSAVEVSLGAVMGYTVACKNTV
jgi:hypothetical protein